MNRFLALTKVDFMASFGIGKSKSEKKQNRSFKTIIILVSVLGLFISTLYNFLFTTTFALSEGKMVYAAMLFTGFAGLMTLTTSIVKVKGIFTGQDYEMLAAMPVTKREIIASKILSLYLVELFYCAIILIPNTIFVTIFSKNPLFLLTGICAIFLAAAVPMVLACLISMFIALVADRFKFGNVISVIFYIIFFTAIMGFSFFMNRGSTSENPEEMLQTYTKMAEIFAWINPSTWLIYLAYTKNFLYFLIYIPANILLVGLVIAFIAIFFDRVHTILTSQRSKAVYVKKDLEVVPQGKLLFKHEAKRFFGSRFYFINSISSGIVAVLMAAFMGYMFSKWGNMLPEGAVDQIHPYIYKHGYVGVLVLCFGIGIATPAAVSISIEGKNFWMMKAYPVDYKALLRAKFWLSTLVLAACGVLASIVLCVLIQTAWYNYIYMILLVCGYVALASIFSLRINLRKYNFNWKNEQECCKNSKAAVLTMLLDWAVMSGLGSTLVIGMFLPYGQFYVAPFAIVVLYLMTYLFYRNTLNTAEKRIEMIQV